MTFQEASCGFETVHRVLRVPDSCVLVNLEGFVGDAVPGGINMSTQVDTQYKPSYPSRTMISGLFR
jgi:hypothetical protein